MIDSSRDSEVLHMARTQRDQGATNLEQVYVRLKIRLTVQFQS
jgi:hypothetical protein